ncbi:MAG: tetratricopeptide repeat protein [Euryhalocaulis sp.]|nr:tetratricopeptide repeat protein [Euryhalocaulis sp.]
MSIGVKMQVSISGKTGDELKRLAADEDFAALEKRLDHLKKAFPDDFLVNRLSADNHYRKQEFEAARALYAKVVQQEARNPALLARAARAAHLAGKLDQAEGLYGRALKIDPKNSDAHTGLVVVQFARRKLKAAAASAAQAMKLGIDPIDLVYTASLAELQLGRADKSEQLLTGLLKRDPKHVGALIDLGNIGMKRGHLKTAEILYREAVLIDPERAAALNNLGTILADMKQPEEAETLIRRSIELAPNDYKMHVNYGRFLHKMNRLEEAREAYQDAIKVNPNSFAAHSNLAGVWKDLNHFSESYEHYERAIRLAPDAHFVRSNHIFTACHDPEVPNEETLGMAERFAETVRAKARPFTHAARKDPRKTPLKIGFISADFREHAVCFFLEALLPRIDRGRFHLTAYANQTVEDDYTRRLKQSFGDWRATSQMSDADLAGRIKADNIDVLIDLSGHTGGNRLPVFAWKPAPVQVTWLGLEATTGLSEIDYIIVDAWSLTEPDEALFTEKPWRMPDVRQCFSPPDINRPVSPLPALKNGYVTFGSFNKYSKLNERTFSVWGEILWRVPQSRLLLKSKSFGDAVTRKRIFETFSNQGISPERIVLRGATASREEHLETYDEIDIALDPIPYPGITTTLEAMWMGAPVLALRGEKFLERASDSILSAAGLPDWIAETPESYIEQAAARAADLESLSALRAGLRDQVGASPLCDADGFARKFENAIKGMYERFAG